MRYTCLRSYRAKGDTVEAVPHRDADQSSAERFATLATRNSRGARLARALALCFAQLRMVLVPAWPREPVYATPRRGTSDGLLPPNLTDVQQMGKVARVGVPCPLRLAIDMGGTFTDLIVEGSSRLSTGVQEPDDTGRSGDRDS